MADRDEARLVAWAEELRAAHRRLRDALAVVRSAGAAGVHADLLLYCHGFCTALTGHHQGEDQALFPAVEAAHPHLRETLRKLGQDHQMIAQLITDLTAAAERAAPPAELDRHLEGLAAIMESHFQYEERSLLAVLAEFQLDATLGEALGTL